MGSQFMGCRAHTRTPDDTALLDSRQVGLQSESDDGRRNQPLPCRISVRDHCVCVWLWLWLWW